MNQLEKLFKDTFAGGELIRMIFSAKRRKSIEYRKVAIRPVKLAGQLAFQAEYTFENKVTHENLSPENACNLASHLIQNEFKQVHIFTLSEDIEILAAKPNNPRISTKPATRAMPSLAHNREKRRIIENGVPCDFLIRLGVMNAKGRVIDRYYSKYRQINRYLEIVEEVLPFLPAHKKLKIIDFGCGKAYLTFALYYYLKKQKGRDVEMIGLDLKEDVIRFCNKIASDLKYESLTFLRGDIADFTCDSADMTVSLHACDTATDYGLINAVCWNSKVILSVPCCQHELFDQIKNDLHQPMLKHGILKDRLTEYLTDGLRGLKLEAAGYDVSMIEFTSLAHTARNIMIKAVKTGSPQSPKAERARSQYDALCRFYQVHPTIGKL